MNHWKPAALFAIISVSLFFRAYQNQYLQFWSDDEAVHSAVVQRMIINGKPTLVSPQPTLGTSIGSLFHILSIPLFLVASMDPGRILTFFSLIGVATTVILYLVGRECHERVGLLAAFLYSSSFLASLYDRRWWPITLTPFFSGLALLLAIKLVKSHQWRCLPLLTLIGSTALHGDPAMLMIFPFTLAVLLRYRLYPPLRYWTYGMFIIALMASPIALFEARHPGSVIAPFLITIARNNHQDARPSFSTFAHTISQSIDTVHLLIFPKPSNHLESQLYPHHTHLDSFARKLSALVAILLCAFPFLRRKQYPPAQQIVQTVSSLFLLVFFTGALVFALVYQHQFQRVYVTLLFPIVFLLLSITLFAWSTRTKFLMVGSVVSLLLINLSALSTSRYQYPLSARMRVIERARGVIHTESFSLYAFGDGYLLSGGFSRLFALQGLIPKKSYDYAPNDWLYRSHSLYLIEPSSQDQRFIVVISPRAYTVVQKDHVLTDEVIDMMRLTVFDNSEGWFRQEHMRNIMKRVSSLRRGALFPA